MGIPREGSGGFSTNDVSLNMLRLTTVTLEEYRIGEIPITAPDMFDRGLDPTNPCLCENRQFRGSRPWAEDGD